MAPSLTENRSVYPSQPSRFFPLKSLTVSDLPSRGGTTGAFFSFLSLPPCADRTLVPAVASATARATNKMPISLPFMVCSFWRWVGLLDLLDEAGEQRIGLLHASGDQATSLLASATVRIVSASVVAQ